MTNEIVIKYAQVDPAAKYDGVFTTDNKQPFSDLNDLRLDGVIVGNYQTCEHNQGILDGTQEHFPDNPALYSWGWWSLSQSDDNGVFAQPPTLIRTFTTNHKSPGITLLFYPHSEDYANKIRCTWYGENLTTILKTGVYEINSTVGLIEESVEEFRRIKLEFLSTNIRNRYIKLFNVEFGLMREIPDDEIDNADILESVDPISDMLSVDTFGFVQKTHTAAFSPVSGAPNDNMMMGRQLMQPYVNGEFYGNFYLRPKGWRDLYNTGKVFEFKLENLIGVMDSYTFMGGMYKDYPLDNILTDIFKVIFPLQPERHFKIDDSVEIRTITNYLPILTCRQALQQVCFAVGAAAITARLDYVLIFKQQILIDLVPEFYPLSTFYLGTEGILL